MSYAERLKSPRRSRDKFNLIERLWKYFRKEILYNKYYEKFSDFQAACQNFFASIKEHKKALRSLLTENFQIIGM